MASVAASARRGLTAAGPRRADAATLARNALLHIQRHKKRLVLLLLLPDGFLQLFTLFLQVLNLRFLFVELADDALVDLGSGRQFFEVGAEPFLFLADGSQRLLGIGQLSLRV